MQKIVIKHSSPCFVVSFVLFILFGGVVSGSENYLPQLQEQYRKFCLSYTPSAEKIRSYADTITEDGLWSDLDYTSKRRSEWSVRNHIVRLVDMAKAYRGSSPEFSGNAQLKKKILLGFGHWLENDYTNPNWWHNEIGIPMLMADLLILMGDDVPAQMVDRAFATSLARSKFGMTGQNRVWLAGIQYVKGLIRGDLDLATKARNEIFSELRVTTKEGIQPDWSFHQHGPMQQFGNYGLAFGDEVTSWAMVMQGTPLALDEKQLALIRNYLLEGPSWILWKGKMDVSGCGRQILPHCQQSKGRSILRQLERISTYDLMSLARYQQVIRDNRNDVANTLVGNKLFWRSDFMVHRRPSWYASVKMSSPRVIGSETCNSDSVLGLHLGDGVMYVYRSGDEYKDIFPVWDWHKLPGATLDQSIEDLLPSAKKCKLPLDFAGGVSDGENGIAALDYQRGVRAKKAWFFLNDMVVCLGAGIKTEGDSVAVTTLEQSLAGADVQSSAGKPEGESLKLGHGGWAYNNGIGYYLIDGPEASLVNAKRAGNWQRPFPTKSDIPVSKNVFTLTMAHDKKNAASNRYAYAVLPQAQPESVRSAFEKSGVEILSNTPELQAIATDSGRTVFVVFYQPGSLVKNGHTLLKSSAPCMVIARTTDKSTEVFVADPTQKLESTELDVDSRTVSVVFNDGSDAGKTTYLKLIH